MAQSLSEGSVFNYTAPTGGVTNGQLIVFGRMAGVALNSAAAGQKVALALDGVHSLAAIATGTKALGLPVGYRDDSGVWKVSAVAAGCTGAAWSAHPTSGVVTYGTKYVIGTIWEAAASAATSVKVRLHGGPLAALL
jgi:predicted RecA/RadA family phage recombinase